MRKLFVAVVVLFSVASATDFEELKGYTVIEVTNVKGKFEGADFGRLVEFDNGWIMRFNEYQYHYAYHPVAVIFAKKIGSVAVFKLLIDDDVYDATDVK